MFPITLFAVTALAVAPTVKDCGVGNSLFTVNAVSLFPVNPIPNEPVTLHLDYTVPNNVVVTDGQAKFAVTYNYIPMAPTVEPLCSNIPCPLDPGRYTNDTVSTWPSGLSGTIVTTISWANQNADQLLCIRITAKV